MYNLQLRRLLRMSKTEYQETKNNYLIIMTIFTALTSIIFAMGDITSLVVLLVLLFINVAIFYFIHKSYYLGYPSWGLKKEDDMPTEGLVLSSKIGAILIFIISIGIYIFRETIMNKLGYNMWIQLIIKIIATVYFICAIILFIKDRNHIQEDVASRIKAFLGVIIFFGLNLIISIVIITLISIFLGGIA